MGGILGLDEKQIGSRTLDLVIYPGEVFANFLIGEQESLGRELEAGRALEQGDGFLPFLRGVIARSEVRGTEVRDTLLDSGLTPKMAANLRDKTGSSTSCVQLLLCKLSPMVAGVQGASREALIGMGQNSLAFTSRQWLDSSLASVPSMEQFAEQGEDCEDQHPTCPLFSFSSMPENAVEGRGEED